MHSANNYFPLVIFVIFAGSFLFRYLKYGSLLGAVIGGQIKETFGEITLESTGTASRTLKVCLYETSNGISEIALVLASKSVLSARVTPMKLSQSDVTSLIALLQKANLWGQSKITF